MKTKSPEVQSGEHRQSEAHARIIGSRAIRHWYEPPSLPGDRLAALRRIRGVFGASCDLEALDREEAAYPYTPSLGIELELYDGALLTRAEKNQEPRIRAELIEHKKSTLYQLAELGLPRDHSDEDYWEFALAPTRVNDILIAEVQVMEDAGVIHFDGRYYPLHVTIGGVTSEYVADETNPFLERGVAGDQLLVLVRALEASGIATTAKRLMMPYEANKKGHYWTGGESGVYEREIHEVIGGGTAVEIRTFCFNSMESLRTILETTSYLGVALGAYQDYQRDLTLIHPLKGKDTRSDARLRSGVSEQDVSSLAEIWLTFSKKVEEIFQRMRLRSPSEQWVEPLHRKHLLRGRRGDFGGLADFLQASSSGADKEMALLQNELRDLIDHIVAEVKKITDDAQP